MSLRDGKRYPQQTLTIEDAVRRLLKVSHAMMRERGNFNDPMWHQFKDAVEDLETWATFAAKEGPLR